MDLGGWLRSLGLEQYEAAFRENAIPTEFGVPLSTETITHLQFITFGSLICYLLIKEPHGFARLISIGKEKLRLWPFPY